MFVQEAETRFRTGLQHLSRGRARDALPFIGAAIEVQKETDAEGAGQATYLSYYGLCLCLTRSDMNGGLNKCRAAVRLDPINPTVWWNLGRVALTLGRKGEAYRAFLEGLRIHPRHPQITRSLRRMGVRRPAVLPFLSRKHPINRVLGRLRAPATPRRAAQEKAASAGSRSYRLVAQEPAHRMSAGGR